MWCRRSLLPTAIGLLALLSLSARTARAQDAVTVRDVTTATTLQSVGVVALLAGDDDGDASGTLAWSVAGGAPREGHPLVRVAGGRLVGSVVGLGPGTPVHLRMTIDDPDGVTGGTRELELDATTRVMPARSLAGRTFIVAPGGSDTGEGTSSSPFATLTHAASLAGAGDTILVRRGSYDERVVIARSGEPGMPLAIVAEMGTVLDGSYPELRSDSAWRSVGRGVWRAVLDAEPAYVAVDEQRLYRFADEAALRAGLAGVERGGWSWDAATSEIAIRLPDGLNPGVTDVRVGRFDVGILIEGQHDVWIQDLEVRYFGSEGLSRGVVLRDCDRVVLRNLNVHHVATGIEIDGGSEHLIDGVEIYDRGAAGWPPSIVEGTDAEGSGVVLHGEAGPGHVLQDVTVHGHYRGVELCAGDATAGEVDLVGSLFFDVPAGAVDLGASCTNVRVMGNRMLGVHAGLAMRPAGGGPVWAVRNVIVPGGTLGESEGRPASALDTSATSAASGTLLLYHNTTRVAVEGGAALALSSGAWSLVAGRNNVWAGTAVGVDLSADLGGLDLDHDALHATMGPPARSSGGAVVHADVASLFAAVGIEEHGVGGDPGFASETMGDATLLETSPLVDRGLALPGINDDPAGSGPDIGAFELGAVDGGPPGADGGGPGVDGGGMPGPDGGGMPGLDAGMTGRPDGGGGGGDDGGCGCSTIGDAAGRRGPLGALVSLVALVTLRRARRRRARRESP